MTTKTIVICQKDLKGVFSGAQRIVHEEIKFFASRGDKVYVVAERINEKAVEQSGGIPYKTFRWPISGYYRRVNYLKRAQKAIKKLKPDLVIGHGDIVQQDILYIHNCVHLAYQAINGVPVPKDHEVAKIHAEILTAQKFKKLVCNSHLMKADLAQRFDIPLDKMLVIYPHYNPSKFNLNAPKTLEVLRNELKVAPEERLLGLVTSGNLKKRNLNLLIESAKLLADKGVRFKILVVAKDKITGFQQKIADLGLTDFFIFAPPVSNVEEYYHVIDIFVLPAHIEEFGMSVLEAMACGKPVVVSSMVGCAEILEAKSRDYILSNFAAQELASKLEGLIQNPELCTELGKLNHQTALKYTDVINAENFKQLVSSV